jgi:small subunit ribosomal protein S11
MSEDTTTTTATTEEKPVVKRKKKVKRSVSFGRVNVLASFNNTIITIADPKGDVLTQASAGGCGFRGSKKGTAYAAQIAAVKAVDAAKQQYGLSKAEVLVKGVGLGRDAAVRALSSSDIAIDTITDVTGVPHGGCRPRKARRV